MADERGDRDPTVREPRQKMTRALGEFMRDFLKSSGLSSRRSGETLTVDWSDIVGPDLARGSRILGIQRGTLLVEVHSPAIQQELSVFLKETILARVRERFPRRNIVSLKCVPASLGQPSPRPTV